MSKIKCTDCDKKIYYADRTVNGEILIKCNKCNKIMFAIRAEDKKE